MKRRLDWPERLAAAIAKVENGQPVSDSYPCVLWAADCVFGMTDVDPLPERDDTAAAAYARMRREGYESLRACLAARLGGEIPLAFARRGDVVLSSGDVESIGICCGEQTAFLRLEGGLVFLPTLEQQAAFAVPFEGS